ncbi:MAG: trpA [Candidatus Angelobacter sp.]|jgi:tryptophan synthase alpha chain|nr:trpA [Candidatus Angelobacter sp.]
MLTFKSRPGLVVYVTCGDPDLATSRAVILAAIDAGADVIELGVPFSDPVADGPVIQRASERALKSGTTLHDVLALAGEIRKARPSAGVIVFSYLNPILRFGMERFAKEAALAGVDGVLVTDMTVEESATYCEIMHSRNLQTIFLAAPTSTDARLKKIAAASRGFIYAVSRTGVTGTKLQSDVRGDAEQLVKRIRKISKLPIAVGFGISSPADFRAVGEYADAAVIGSAIVKIIEENGDSAAKAADAVAQWINSLKSIGSKARA